MTIERVPDAQALEADDLCASYQRGEVSRRVAVPRLMDLLIINRGEANQLLEDIIKPEDPPAWHDMRTAAEVAENKMRDLSHVVWPPS